MMQIDSLMVTHQKSMDLLEIIGKETSGPFLHNVLVQCMWHSVTSGERRKFGLARLGTLLFKQTKNRFLSLCSPGEDSRALQKQANDTQQNIAEAVEQFQTAQQRKAKKV